MKTIRLLSIILLALSLPTFAQVAPSSGGGGGGGGTTTTPVVQPTMPDGFAPALPITSQAVLLAEAAKGITKVTASVYGNGLVYGATGSKTYTENSYTPSVPNQTDFRELAQMVSLVDFQFEVRNPLDVININVAFRTKEGRSVFEGYQNFKLVKTADGSYTSSPIITVDMWPVSEQLIDVPGAYSVEVSLLNENGETTTTQWLRRDERTGKFFFSLYWAGQQNVLLTAYKYDGNSGTRKAVYSARTGTQQPVYARSVEPYAAVKDVLAYQPDITVVELTVPALGTVMNEFLNRGVSPLVQVSFTKKGLLRFYAELPSGEWAKGFWIRRADATNWEYYNVGRGTTTDIPRESGVYQIIPDWSLNQRNSSFGGGEGKGGGTTQVVPAEKG